MRTKHTQIVEVAEIGAVAREQRKRLGLTQRQLGELANVGSRFISELENGKLTVELGRALRVLVILGVRPKLEYVIDDEEA